MQKLREIKTDNFIEREYTNFTSIEHRKKFAQFFTPFPLAKFMTKWLLQNEDLNSVLEPAFGLGVFSRAILAENKKVKIKGFEIDPNIYEEARRSFASNKNVSIILQDYIYNDWNNKYDGIICNPPFFKFHDYDNKNILVEIEKRIGCKLNGFTNLYSLFLLKSIFQLNKNGHAAYIVPSEFLNSDYGKAVKEYLVKSKTLRHILVIDFEENVFDDALTTASIILCANDNKTEKVNFSNIKTLEDLEKSEKLILKPLKSNKSINFADLNPQIKWRAYYQKQNSVKFKNLVPFSHFGKVVRGIATGANDYFKFNQSKAEKYSIPQKYLLPCICRSADVKTPFFTKIDFQSLKENDKDIFLLNVIDNSNKNVNEYIERGIKEKIDKKHLTSKRLPWYKLENRLPSPIWVSVFNRNGLKFIRNEASISNLTAFHCIYSKQQKLFSNVNVDLLFAYLLTDVANQIFDDNRREYGNGLKKFEPNDLNKAKMLNLELLENEKIEEILHLFISYKNSVIQEQKDNDFINRINNIFIENYT